MTENPDPKEIKILSDILALVLEEQSGQSANALETIKKRAKKNAVTGGALKNLFHSIATNPPKPRARSSNSKNTTANAPDILKARTRITELTQSINQLDTDLRHARRQNEALRSELLHTQQLSSEMRYALSIAESRAPFRVAIIIISMICGLLMGIAGTVLVHTLQSAPPIDNSRFLRQ